MAKVSSGTMTVTVFAALVGLGGAFVVRQTMQKPVPTETAGPTAAPAPVIVPLAAADLQPGRKLTLNDIAPQRLSQEEFRKSEFRKITFLSNTMQIQGRTLRKTVPAGRPFQPDDFYPDGTGPDIADRLQAGYRAVTVPIETVGSVNGFAVPGSIVDVLFRAKPEGARPAVTLTLLERIEVLAFNVNTTQGLRDQAAPPNTTAATVTLAVTPQQAKILKVVEGRGDMSLTLRNPKDDFQFAPVEVGGMRPDLFEKTKQKEAALEPTPDEEFTPVPARQADVAAKEPATQAKAETIEAKPTKLIVDENADDDAIAASLLTAIARADREMSADSRTAAEGRIDRIVGNASERLTLEDLLGVKPAPKKKTLEVYLGGVRNVINFEDRSQDTVSDIPIRTPVTGNPPAAPQGTTPVNTAQTRFQR